MKLGSLLYPTLKIRIAFSIDITTPISNQYMNLKFRVLTKDHIPQIAILGNQLNPNLPLEQITEYLNEMFTFPNYHCFGLLSGNTIIGISSGWITVKLYSGKQLEVDNVIIDNTVQSKGYGKQFFKFIEEWAKENSCKSIELNTYISNSRSHKFYYNLGYSILAFHFVKKVK